MLNSSLQKHATIHALNLGVKNYRFIVAIAVVEY